MRLRPKYLVITSSLLILIASIFAGQACSRSSFSSRDPQSLQGNGDSYGGKTTRFALSNTSTCAELDSDGQPLPVRMIFVLPDRTAQLVRDNCQDLKNPILLASSDITFDASTPGRLEYQGGEYVALPDADEFGVVAARCPLGMSLKSGAVRVNQVAAGQALEDYSQWHNHVGIGTRLAGSFAGLYNFEISRNDPANLDYWRRIHPAVDALKPSTMYAYSFLAAPGTLNEVWFSAYLNGVGALSVILDATNGSQRLQQSVGGFPPHTVDARPMGNGYFFTIYFTTPAASGSSVTGIAPNGASPAVPAVGDSIFATAIQLEEVSNFCQ